MSGVLSTIINFSMLGFLHRIHKLSIRDDIQLNTEKLTHGISFLRLERHKSKEGIGAHKNFSLDISNEEIYDALSRAEMRAKKIMEELGMAEDLKNKKCGTHLQ